MTFWLNFVSSRPSLIDFSPSDRTTPTTICGGNRMKFHEIACQRNDEHNPVIGAIPASPDDDQRRTAGSRTSTKPQRATPSVI